MTASDARADKPLLTLPNEAEPAAVGHLLQ